MELTERIIAGYVNRLNKAAASSRTMTDEILTGSLDRVLENYARTEVESALRVDGNPLDNLQHLKLSQLAVALEGQYGLDEDIPWYAGQVAVDYVRTCASKEFARQTMY